jgi:hypothetical protein
VSDALLGLVPHPLTVVAHVLSQPLRTAPFRLMSALSLSAAGFTGGWLANLGGISIIALLMSTATGFKSLA